MIVVNSTIVLSIVVKGDFVVLLTFILNASLVYTLLLTLTVRNKVVTFLLLPG